MRNFLHYAYRKELQTVTNKHAINVFPTLGNLFSFIFVNISTMKRIPSCAIGQKLAASN